MSKPVLCAKCQAEIPSLAKRLSRANEDLALFVGRTYYNTLREGVQAVEKILEANGFIIPDWPIVSSKSARIHEYVGDGKYITLTWHRMEESGNYEITAYVN